MLSIFYYFSSLSCILSLKSKTMKKLVIAEKPSVGREIAKTLKCFEREQGFVEGDKYIVTWALGHLVELAEPQHYSERYKRWSLKDLPMLPEKLDQVVISDTEEQFKVIESLLKRDDIESVVIATDAGREGELVARWILKLAQYSGKCERLWISSQTEKAILDGFNNLQPSSLYDNLYSAAECRANADWYVGMNVTRALTTFYDAKLSSGRVQTPTLALIVRREEEIEKFLGSFYYSCRASFGLFSASYYPEENSIRFNDEKKAEELSLYKGRVGKVVKVEREEKREHIPVGYDLTELQRDANITFGFSAKETLDTLQRLYEVHKIVTYPRTDSSCITPDIVPTLKDRIKALENTIFSRQVDEYLENGFISDNPRFVDEAEVSDHHAIIPTEEKVRVEKLSENERKLWQLIALRFLEVLGKDYIYETTTVSISVDGDIFKARIVVPKQKGYRGVSESCGLKSATISTLSDDDGLALLSIKEMDEVTVESIRVKKTSTTPPERYTDATLLSAMEHAGRFVDDKSLKSNLSSGLGTPATRADMIEKLIQNRYIERDGKYFVATSKGREVVRLSPLVLRSPELTGEWEGRLEKISKGKESAEVFISDIKKMASELVKEVEKSTLVFEPKFKDGKKCPYCGGEMMRSEDSDGSIHYICQRLSCSYEEKEVREKIASSTSSKKSFNTLPNGKIRVVINKSPVKTPQVYEKRIEVVRESKLRYRGVDNKRTKDTSFSSHFNTSSSGGTMADFFLLSKQREEERRNRKKK